MATPIDDNAADEKSDKSRCQLFIILCTSCCNLRCTVSRKNLQTGCPAGGFCISKRVHFLSLFTPHMYTTKDICALILLHPSADMSDNGM